MRKAERARTRAQSIALRARAGLAVIARTTIEARAELLTATALFGGWALFTAAIAEMLAVIPLVGPAIARAAWLGSSGLFLLALCGRDLIARLIRMGLYVLTREDER